MIADENVYDYDEFDEDEDDDEEVNYGVDEGVLYNPETSREDLEQSPLWHELFEVLEAEQSRTKFLMPNYPQIAKGFSVYKKLEKLLKNNGTAYTIDMSIDELFHKNMQITATALYVDISPQNISEYQSIINDVRGISHTALTDGKLEIIFGIADVFIEVKQEE